MRKPKHIDTEKRKQRLYVARKEPQRSTNNMIFFSCFLLFQHRLLAFTTLPLFPLVQEDTITNRVHTILRNQALISIDPVWFSIRVLFPSSLPLNFNHSLFSRVVFLRFSFPFVLHSLNLVSVFSYTHVLLSLLFTSLPLAHECYFSFIPSSRFSFPSPLSFPSFTQLLRNSYCHCVPLPPLLFH